MPFGHPQHRVPSQRWPILLVYRDHTEKLLANWPVLEHYTPGVRRDVAVAPYGGSKREGGRRDGFVFRMGYPTYLLLLQERRMEIRDKRRLEIHQNGNRLRKTTLVLHVISDCWYRITPHDRRNFSTPLLSEIWPRSWQAMERSRHIGDSPLCLRNLHRQYFWQLVANIHDGERSKKVTGVR